jgi:D-beta-D-heptose 7-phosphate kinase/D-beta-D-heptose 1-phosphate adenosyltransferase
LGFNLKDLKEFVVKNTVVIASGHFDPLHVGHLEYLKLAKGLGDTLLVVVSTDENTFQKKGYVFMPQKERIEIINSLRYVDGVMFSIDKDSTIKETIRYIHRIFTDYSNLIFAKGGDRFANEIPENEVCKELGIPIVDGLGKKIQSSSDLIEKRRVT